MDLRQLRYFVAAVEAGGIRRAAPRLFITQPAISRAMRLLEHDLGAELFERTPRGVVLTDAGRELMTHARAILRQADLARASVREVSRRRPGLRIGAVAGVLSAGELTAPILRDFRHAQPRLHIEFEELSFCDQAGPVLDGHLDVALVRLPLVHPDLKIVPLAYEPRALLVNAEHHLAVRSEVGVEDVLEEPTMPMATPDDWSGFWQLDDLRGRSHEHVGVVPVSTIASMQFAAMSERLVLSVPASMGRIAPNSLVHYLPLRDAPPSIIALAHRCDDQRVAVSAFVEQAIHTTDQQIGLLPGGVSLGGRAMQ